MNREFENSGREMPYRLPPQSLEALHERILSRTSRRPASPPRTVRRYCLTAAAAAAVTSAAEAVPPMPAALARIRQAKKLAMLAPRARLAF